jgi:NADPH:quinone reductase-like Zn-dependent oxidoreductase
MTTSAVRCFPLPKTLPFEQGAMLIVNPLIALAFFDIAKRGKHTALVSNAAAGALGKMILRLGQKHALPVINIVRKPEQAALLHSLGAKYVLNNCDPDFHDRLSALAQQLQATLILDPVGSQQT